MKISEHSALLMVDVQGGDMTMDWDNPAFGSYLMEEDRKMNVNAKKVADVFRRLGLPVIYSQEVHRDNHVDFGRELDGAEGVHLLESDPRTDFTTMNYPQPGDYTFVKRRYSCFFGTDLEILLKGLKVDTLYLVGGMTNVCVHYTAVDAHQNDYHFKVVTDAVAGSSPEASEAALEAMKYLQRDSWVTTADIESALDE